MDLSLRAKAEAFAAMHQTSRILVLPNAWDAASARIFELEGFPAVATTSVGCSWVLGYPDGERIPLAEMLLLVRRIAATVDVPVSADMEAGYGATPEVIAATVRATIKAGAVGINLEDGAIAKPGTLVDAGYHAEVIREAARAADVAGVPIVINARVDTYLRHVGDDSTRFDETARRANAYLAAGAGCTYVMAVPDGATIARLAAAIHGPLNVRAGHGAPPIDDLERMGVRRVTFASQPVRATLALLARVARELRTTGTSKSLDQGDLPYGNLNGLLDRPRNG
jgi:2-methylisocitrate lyase-like PEP mutase family enzyme